MPCLEWLAEELEWEQGSGPKGPMSCRTQGWISRRPERAYLRLWQQLPTSFNRNFAFFQPFVNLPCYSIGTLQPSQFSPFSLLSNGNHAVLHFSVNFPRRSIWNLCFVKRNRRMPWIKQDTLQMTSIDYSHVNWEKTASSVWSFVKSVLTVMKAVDNDDIHIIYATFIPFSICYEFIARGPCWNKWRGVTILLRTSGQGHPTLIHTQTPVAPPQLNHTQKCLKHSFFHHRRTDRRKVGHSLL